jgi:hypothetical protein
MKIKGNAKRKLRSGWEEQARKDVLQTDRRKSIKG